ncbi:Yip1 family protein [Lactobacillus bombicola]|uniref:Uncharacterized protein n=1 Tax=Lactobacillus bombicola TaxID=1505723 RepID=A0A396SXE3_9LACO|nr:Yip1 family protein [Lactobacillus bombicola]RHW54441.1 hypothetical protein DS835_05175 [Lactobacillus bombicola]
MEKKDEYSTTVANFFNFFIENLANEQVNSPEYIDDDYNEKVKKSINQVKLPEYTIYMCDYIFEHLNDMWSPQGGLGIITLNSDDYYDFELLKKDDIDLYNKINTICSVIYKIKNSDEIINQKIDDSSKNLTQVNEKLSKQKDSLENKINNQTDTVLSKVKSLIYPEIITILGIFTAITFAIFGGMNLLTDLFKNIGSTPASLGQTMILAVIFGLIMWGIIELLFYWISKIKGITDSTKDKNKTYFNWLAIGVLAGILILGILLFTKTIK